MKYPSVEDAWKGKGAGTWLPSVMEYHRFRLILTNWHWINTAVFTQAERKVKNKAKPFWPVDGFLEKLSDNFSEQYNCGQFLDVESTSSALPSKAGIDAGATTQTNRTSGTLRPSH